MNVKRPPKTQRRSLGRREAFSLVEILVAMGVLAIILLIFMQMQSVTFRTCKLGVARVDALTQSRAVMGLIERDIQSIVLRRDLAAFVDQNGDPACAFYTLLAAPSGTRKLSLVQYKFIPPSASAASGSTGLLRYDLACDYPSAGGTSTALAFGNLTRLANLSSATPQTLGESIVGFAIQFQRIDGQMQLQYQFSHGTPSLSSNTSVIIISMAILDSAAAKLIQKSGGIDAVTAGLSGSPAANESYAHYWNTLLAKPSFWSGLPQPVRTGLYVFERRIAVPVFPIE
jgi:hypothetical protein